MGLALISEGVGRHIIDSLDVLGRTFEQFILKSCVSLADTLTKVFGGSFDKFAKCLAIAEAPSSPQLTCMRFLNEKMPHSIGHVPRYRKH